MEILSENRNLVTSPIHSMVLLWFVVLIGSVLSLYTHWGSGVVVSWYFPFPSLGEGLSQQQHRRALLMQNVHPRPVISFLFVVVVVVVVIIFVVVVGVIILCL